jgi:hypothetical protein
MEDFLFGLLGFLFEILIESLDEIAVSAIVDGGSRILRHFRVTVGRGNPIVASSVLIIAGLVFGFLSAVIFPHPLVHRSKYHGISLLISPFITGVVMAAIGRRVRRRGHLPVRIESFSYGFAFAFAFSLIRILMVH